MPIPRPLDVVEWLYENVNTSIGVGRVVRVKAIEYYDQLGMIDVFYEHVDGQKHPQ